MSKLTSDKQMLEYDINSLYSNIFCFSTTRHGGVSKGEYSSFNCNAFCGDNWNDIVENRKKLCKLLPQKPELLVFPHQTHGVNVLNIDKTFIEKDELERKSLLEGVDALITKLAGVCLCISTADCIPVMLFDHKRGVACAIHAGWRGTVNGIVRESVKRMINDYDCIASDIHASIGPGISLESFEVGDEVYSEFKIKNFDIDKISAKDADKDKWHIDLPKANKLELMDVGLKEVNIECSDICTYKNNDMFFSARQQGIASGRILSGIMLLNNVGKRF